MGASRAANPRHRLTVSSHKVLVETYTILCNCTNISNEYKCTQSIMSCQYNQADKKKQKRRYLLELTFYIYQHGDLC